MSRVSCSRHGKRFPSPSPTLPLPKVEGGSRSQHGSALLPSTFGRGAGVRGNVAGCGGGVAFGPLPNVGPHPRWLSPIRILLSSPLGNASCGEDSSRSSAPRTLAITWDPASLRPTTLFSLGRLRSDQVDVPGPNKSGFTLARDLPEAARAAFNEAPPPPGTSLRWLQRARRPLCGSVLRASSRVCCLPERGPPGFNQSGHPRGGDLAP